MGTGNSDCHVLCGVKSAWKSRAVINLLTRFYVGQKQKVSHQMLGTFEWLKTIGKSTTTTWLPDNRWHFLPPSPMTIDRCAGADWDWDFDWDFKSLSLSRWVALPLAAISISLQLKFQCRRLFATWPFIHLAKLKLTGHLINRGMRRIQFVSFFVWSARQSAN